MSDNFLYYGDNLDILRRYIKDESVDLVYLDPPYNSKRTYNVLFEERNGAGAASQIKAFEDTWTWDKIAADTFQQIVENGGMVSQAMQSFRLLFGESDMLAYLSMMTPRLVELHRILKPKGSIFLHCDPTASHYLKIILDVIFGDKQFRNEIVWCYTRPGTKHQKQFSGVHDTIFWYSKGNEWLFNGDDVRIPYSEKTLERGKYSVATSKVTKGISKRILPKGGKVPEDWWQIPMIQGNARERLGYPTQKPEALLERIIKASSNERDVVLDPFCGCGTTISVAQRLKRQWIGIDITQLAITLIKHRLQSSFGKAVTYKVVGEPVSLPDAKTLAEQDPYQFQWWALGLVGARPTEQKKGSDKGIDGRIYFHDEIGGKTKQVIISVKAGHTNVSHVRDLRGVVEREKADIGVLITMEKTTQPMRTEAAGSGFYHSEGWNKNYPKIQLLTIAELLNNKIIDMPPIHQVNITFKSAPLAKTKEGYQMSLDVE